MAKHRARSLKRLVPVAIAALLAGGAAVAAPAFANSPSNVDQLRVVAQNSVDKFNCYFDVQRVDQSNGIVTGTMQGNAFPASLGGYLTIAHNSVNCQLFTAAGALVSNISANADHPNVTTGTTSVVVPYDVNGYLLCGTATAVKNNGSSSTVPYTCVHS